LHFARHINEVFVCKSEARSSEEETAVCIKCDIDRNIVQREQDYCDSNLGVCRVVAQECTKNTIFHANVIVLLCII
jgi:hypothetical protein